MIRSLLRTVKLLGFFLRFGAELLLRQPRTRQARAAWLHRFCASALRGMGIELTVEGTFPARGALIANHLSYLDIIVFAALQPCVFCSKAEIRGWPILGWMTTMAGTVYVERGHGGSARRAGAQMKAAAEAGLPVVFFPEGTTTNSHALLPFHSGLLAFAMEGGEPITPAYLSYTLHRETRSPGTPAPTVEDDVCFWGDTPMLPHILRFLGLRGVRAHVRIAPGPIQFSGAHLHRKAAAVEARQAVLSLAPARQLIAEDLTPEPS